MSFLKFSFRESVSVQHAHWKEKLSDTFLLKETTGKGSDIE
jgi:hypothetical protein